MHRIDTHHHILPPRYMKAVGESAIAQTLVSGKAPRWTPAHSIEVMDRNGIETAVVSISAPGFSCASAEGAEELCRHCNEFAARMRQDYPGRFGSFASLPLPDVDLSLKEISYSLDQLKADGVCLLTNYNGLYLGDDLFELVFDELNRRGAVVYVHPTVMPFACLCSLPPASLEYPFDTTRAIANLIFKGTFIRYRNLRFIFSHAGGAITSVAERLSRLEARPDLKKGAPDGVAAELRRLYFDTALSANDLSLSGLLQITSTDKILFGSDFPHAPEATLATSVSYFSSLQCDPIDLIKIERENARRLMPNLLKGRVVEMLGT